MDDHTDRQPPVRLGTADLRTVAEVAAELRVSRTTIHRLIRAGDLRAYALGSQYRILGSDLDDYLASARGPSDGRSTP